MFFVLSASSIDVLTVSMELTAARIDQPCWSLAIQGALLISVFTRRGVDSK